MPANQIIKQPKVIDVSVDTMQEHLSIVSSQVSPNSKNKLVALHVPAGQPEHQNTELLGIRQEESVGPIKSFLVHYYMDCNSASGWSCLETELPEVYDPASEEKVLSGVKAITGFHQNGVSYLFVEYQSPVGEHSSIVQLMWGVRKNGRPIWSEKLWSHKGDDARTILSSVRQLSVHRKANSHHIVYGVTRGFGEVELGRGDEQFFVLEPSVPDAEVLENDTIQFDAYHDSNYEIPGWAGVEHAASYQLTMPQDSVEENFRYTLLRLRDGGLEFHTLITLPEDEQHDLPRLGFETGAITVKTPNVDLTGARILEVNSGPKDTLLVHKRDGELGLVCRYQSDQPSYMSLMDLGHGPQSTGRICTGTKGFLGEEDSQYIIYVTDTDTRQLWVMRLTNDIKSAKWSLLGDEVEEITCPRVMPNGEELFTLAPRSQKIIYKVQNPQTTSWDDIKLAVSSSGSDNILPISAHVFDIEVLDENGLPCAQQPVILTSDKAGMFYLDGMAYRLGPRLPVTANTNQLGRIRCVMRAGGLKAPTICAKVDGLLAVKIKPNSRITERLAGNAKGYNVADKISSLAPVEHKQQVRQMIRSFGDAASKAKRDALCDGSIRRSYTLSLDESSADFSENIGEISPVVTTLGCPFSHIGDFFSFLAKGLNQVKALVVNILDAGVEFLVTVGKQVWRFATKVFDSIIDGFEALGHFLAKVFEKIGSLISDIGKKILEAVSFIFDGKDVFAANDALQASVRGFFKTAAFTAAKAGKEINQSFQQKIDQVDALIDQYTDQATGVVKNKEELESQGYEYDGLTIPAPKILARTNRAGADVMGSAMCHFDEHEAGVQTELPETELEALKTFLDKVKNNFKQDVEGPIHEISVRYSQDDEFLAKLKDSPFMIFKIVKGILKSLMKMAGDLFEMALNLMRILVNRVFQLLDAPLNIPFLNSIVRLWSGDIERNLSMFDVITLPFAFVGTALWKIISGRSIVTPTQSMEFCRWIHQEAAPIDIFEIKEQLESPQQHRSLGAAAVTADPSKNYIWNKVVMGIFNGLKILIALGGILFIPLQLVSKAFELTGVDLNKKIKGLLSFANILSPVLGAFSWFIKLCLEGVGGKEFPSGIDLTSDERIKKIETALAAIFILPLLAVIGLILFVTKVIEAVASVIDTLLGEVKFIVMKTLSVFGYGGYLLWQMVTSVNDINDTKNESLQGLKAGGAVLAWISTLVSMIIGTAEVISFGWFKIDPSSGAIAILVTLALAGIGIFYSKSLSIADAGLEYSRYDYWQEG